MAAKRATKLVPIREAAAALSVCPLTLRLLARDKKVPHYRLSAKVLRFDVGELRAFMKLPAENRSAGGDEPEPKRAA